MLNYQFYQYLSPLLAAIGDGYTKLYAVKSGEEDFILPLDFKIIADDLVVSKVAHTKHSNLLGAKIHSVNNIEISKLLEKTGAFFGYDNKFGNMVNLINFLKNTTSMKILIPE